ncbi:uncharacterized protein C8Q71DRAFT_276907 [Rhodofomes roseus]|uniref:F-box domain-containing protein n=1 Tax=Rhodofomes roseus TaxID=34475 RepID=A0ABQ8K4Y6_9APHY|nr:uncharacterized protein C8Q71DRAFT_276907 [Rhodofomes roseus]KAH9832004.1 hypothetical protein C8Q71DRAFT_276907 [Rhodofomes roseus]
MFSATVPLADNTWWTDPPLAHKYVCVWKQLGRPCPKPYPCQRVGMRCIVPIEIVEEIIDHNRYDPPTLLACALVCRDWAPRSQCHLQRKPTLTIRSAAQLNLIGSLLVSKRSRGLYAKVRLLRIIDDPSTPFFHSLPLCLPGQHLPEVAAVLLEGVDWTTFRPHVSFFTWLSRFSSVTSLCIHGCALRPVAHTLRMARGLPKLKQTLVPLSDRMRDYAPVDTVVALDNVLIGTDADAELRELHMRAHPDLEHQHRSLEAGMSDEGHCLRSMNEAVFVAQRCRRYRISSARTRFRPLLPPRATRSGAHTAISFHRRGARNGRPSVRFYTSS